MHVTVSQDMGSLLDSATEVSKMRGKYFVGVEHLFEAVLQRKDQWYGTSLEKYEALLEKTAQVCHAQSWKGVPPTADGEVYYTPRCAALISEAQRIATQLGNVEAVTGHVALAILTDPRALPSRCMDSMGSARLKLTHDLRDRLLELKIEQTAAIAESTKNTEVAAESSQAHSSAATLDTRDDGVKDHSAKVEEFTRDLTQMARDRKIHRAVGRNNEVMQLVEICARQGKNNVILVGEAGTGKTKIVEDLACRMVRGRFKDLIEQNRIIELNVSALLSGTQFRGSFEEKIVTLLEELKSRKDTILFIDEIHLIMGAGATDGDSIDLANLLKPALGRGEIRVIGATTLKEYRQFIAKDPALERRFQMLRVEQLSPEATVRVLTRLAPLLARHHQVTISPEAIEAVVKLTQRYMPNRNFPDKAIDLLDQACASFRINAIMSEDSQGNGAELCITPHSIRKAVSQVASVPIEEITREERARLSNMDEVLMHKIIGQDEAVNKVVSVVVKSRVGLADPNRPDAVMLFLGPTGVGKTQLCKELAHYVFGSLEHLITFDMSEYSESHSIAKLIGAPPGYVGSDQEGLLTSAVQNHPFSIILFDEIEKASPQIFDMLLPVLDEGRLKNSDGRIIDFKNTIIIFTSNIGADVLARGDTGTERGDVIHALEEHFRPEFINRIDEIVPFYPLLQEDVRTVLRIMLNELRRRISGRDMGIRMFQRAYEYLGKIGYSPEYGARELKRTLERYIAGPISERILDGTFSDGDMIDVKMEGDELVFVKGEPRQSTKEEPKSVSS
ncbi:MAG: ATP-dependent Clp protease ATP-binding subunit [Candidatus Hydrogenedentota bacterium]